MDLALEALQTAGARPGEVTGRVRLSVPSSVVRLVVLSLVQRFLKAHPSVEVEVRVENRMVNVVAEGLDAGIRLTDAVERDMVQVRLLGPSRFVIVGAPAYLRAARRARRSPGPLAHECICIRSTTSGELYAREL
jgi:DNA-binding transcriptional LysR family regulator